LVDIVAILTGFVSFFGIYAILAISLNLEYGYAGQPNFGQVLFYGVGAFVAAIVAADLLPLLAHVSAGNICGPTAYAARYSIGSSEPGIAIPVWILGLILAMAAGGIIGLLLSYPAIRVKEEWYLSMILLVAGEAFVTVVQNTPQIACGFFGLNGIQNPFFGISQLYSGSTFASSPLGIDFPSILYAIIIMGFTGICYFVAQKLANSPYGRLLKSIRDDKVASASLGKDVSNVRKQIMVIGSIMAGLAGGLYVYHIGVAVTDDYVPAVTFTIWVMMILGGYANNRGVLIGAFVLTLLEQGAVELGLILQPVLPSYDTNLLTYLEYVAEAVILILLLIFRPKGLVPETRIQTKAYELFDFGKSASVPKVIGEEKKVELEEEKVPVTPVSVSDGPPVATVHKEPLDGVVDQDSATVG
jgi:branched-chain amino acid transport system permease protein